MMKKLLLSLAAVGAVPAFAETNVGISIGINQPGVYGRINIGNYPEPVVVYPQPVIVQPTPVAVYQSPIYLYVPPQHQQDWRRYCSRYSACGQPVFFVREEWIKDRWAREHEHDPRFAPPGRRDHGRGNAYGRDKEHRDHGRGHDRRDRDRD